MAAAPAPCQVIVVMGVSGSGKSTVGGLLADRLSVPYAESDDFHPAANIDKMSAGRPLDDADRAPWLDGSPGLIASRLAARMQHFMPPGLLPSQFEALEPLQPDEAGAVVSVEGGTRQILERALAVLPR